MASPFKTEAADDVSGRQSESLANVALEGATGHGEICRGVRDFDGLGQMGADPCLEGGDQPVGFGEVTECRGDAAGGPLIDEEVAPGSVRESWAEP